MGCCLSKKNVCASSPPPVALPDPPEKPKSETQAEKKEETVIKKEISITEHRKSHEVERQKSEDEKDEMKRVEELVEKGKNTSCSNGLEGDRGGGVVAVRTSSCTKEEVDAILIQCGRLSRSSSAGKAVLSSENGGRKYSGSKRSYDFDRENGKCNDGDDEAVAIERENRRRQSGGRRRTPSREREKEQRSGSRERGGGRRVSRSPGRRSESPSTTNPNSSSSTSRPGKMLSVPATGKSNNAGRGEPNAVKRTIQVKRNVATPRARSPARMRENHQQQPICLSRSNSPYRRNPLADIDTNIIAHPHPQGSRANKNETRRRSLDINLQDPNTSYAALLLEDIQNFHQKITPPPPSLLTITKAVSDLNSSCHPILESEVAGHDDLMQPSFHKYVTVRRGTTDDLEDQESSGSNAINWAPSSCLDPNSAESSRSVNGVSHNKNGRGTTANRIPNMAPSAAAAAST